MQEPINNEQLEREIEEIQRQLAAKKAELETEQGGAGMSAKEALKEVITDKLAIVAENVKLAEKSEQLAENLQEQSVSLADVALIAPNGGEQWQPGETQTISWNTNGALPGDYIERIELLKDGEHLLDIAPYPSQLSTAGSLQWQIPQTVQTGGNFRVQITLVKLSLGIRENDMSDLPFAIGETPISIDERTKPGSQWNLSAVEKPAYLREELQAPVQTYINMIFDKKGSILAASEAIRKTNNAALIDAFHDFLLDFIDDFTQRGKIEKVK